MFLDLMMNNDRNEISLFWEEGQFFLIFLVTKVMCAYHKKFKHYENPHVKSVHCCSFGSRTQ